MTPLTRADAIARRGRRGAGSRRRVAPPIGVGRADAGAARGRDRRARPAAAASSGRRSSARAARGRGRCATHDPEAFAAAVAGRHGRGRVGRRAKLVVIELSGDAALTIHLKMTGQLFVVPADAPEDPYVRLVLELADGRELRFRDIRKFGRVGLYGRDPVTGELVAEVGGADGLRGLRARAARRRRSRCAASGGGCAGARAGSSRCCSTRRSSPASATSTPTRRCGGAPAPAALRGVAPAARRAAALRGDPGGPRRGGRATRLVDRRLHRARRRRLDAGAPARLPADRRAVPALRPADQARSWSARARRTSARGASGCRRPTERAQRAILRTHRPAVEPCRRGRRWTELGGRGAVGLTPAEADACRGRSRATERTKRAAATRRAAAGRRRRRQRCGRRRDGATRRSLDVHPAAVAGVHPRGRHVRDPRRASTRRSRSATGSAWSGRTAPARRRCCGSRPAATSPTAARSTASAACTIGLLAQEAHFDAAFMAAPDLRTAVRHRGGAPRARWPTSSSALERDGRVAEPRYADAAAPSSRSLGGYTLDQRVDAALTGLGFTPRTSGRSRRRRCRAASRRGPRSPGSSSPTPICSSSTSRRTTSTSTRSSGSRSTSGAEPGSLLVASHDRAFLDATVTRIWELRDRRLTAFRGDYSAYHRQREERDARAAEGRRHAGRGRSPASASSSSATAATASSRKMHEHEARLERLQADASEAPRAGRKLAPPADGAGRRRARPGRARSSSASKISPSATCRAWRPATDGRRRRNRGRRARAVPGRAARRADRHRRAERGGQDDAPAHDRRRAAAARRR